MPQNPFTHEAARLRFLEMRRDRTNVFAIFCNCCEGIERDDYAALWWAATAVIAEYVAYDDAVANIANTIPSRRDTDRNHEAFFVALAQLAQLPDEPPLSADTLRQHGLLPTTCRLTMRDFRRLATRVVLAIESNDTDGAASVMRALAEFCTFSPDTPLQTTTRPDSPP